MQTVTDKTPLAPSDFPNSSTCSRGLIAEMEMLSLLQNIVAVISIKHPCLILNTDFALIQDIKVTNAIDQDVNIK